MSSRRGRRWPRCRTPTASCSSEVPSDESSYDWLREAVRMLNSAGRLARAAHLALRSTSALLRPAENLVCASAISLGSAANCLLAASTYLCSLAMRPDSPVPGLCFALRVAAKRVCTGASNLNSQMSPLSKAMHSTAISLALAAASFEEAALQAAVFSSHHHGRDRSRSRSPRYGSPRDSIPCSESSASSDSRCSHDESSRDGAPCQNCNVKISHILIKHKGSRHPIDNNDKPVTRSKDQAMDMVINIHEQISGDLITFADAAVAFSECTSAHRQGDIQKQFQIGCVQQSFKDAAFSLAPGEVSPIFESRSGYHILQRRE